MMNRKQCKILKYYGCNTNIISADFLKRNQKYLKIRQQITNIEHSNENSSMLSSTIVVDATVQIRNHNYRSNWAVVNCRYDVILGTPWRMDNNVIANYKKKYLTVNGRLLRVPKTMNSGARISEIGLKKFSILIRKNAHKKDFETYHLVQVKNL